MAPRLTGTSLGAVFTLAIPLLVLITVFYFAQQTGGQTWDEALDHTGVAAQLGVIGRLLSGDFSAHFSQIPENFAFYGIIAVLPAYAIEQVFVHLGRPDAAAAFTYALHATAFAYDLLTVFVTFLILRRTVVSFAWAWAGAGLLALFPLWLGFGFFNHKDVPTAFFTTLSLYAAIRLLQADNSTKDISRFTALLAFATVCLAGLKIPALALIIPSWCAGLFALLHARRFRTVGMLVAATIVGVGLVTPIAWTDPLHFMIESFTAMARHSWGGCTLSGGYWMCPQQPDWSALKYMRIWYMAQIPVVVGVGTLGAIALLTWRGRVQFLITASLLLPLALIVMRNSTLYDGLRHLLFTIPLIFILSVLFWHDVAQRIGNAPVTIGIAALAVLFGWDNIAMSPYNYVYFNLPTRALADDRNFVTDLWGFSLKEAARLPVVNETSIPVIANPAHLVTPYLTQPHPMIVWPAGTNLLRRPGRAIVIAYTREIPAPPADCTGAQFVTRWLPLGRELRMSYAANCPIR